MTRLKYPPRNGRTVRSGVSAPPLKAVALPKSKRLRAKFVDRDGRYATINGISYPVLLTSCLSGCRYEEDMRDSAEYPVEWCRSFAHDLGCRTAAILASDADEDGWKFLGLFQVHNLSVSSFLTCRLGAKLTKLELIPVP